MRQWWCTEMRVLLGVMHCSSYAVHIYAQAARVLNWAICIRQTGSCAVCAAHSQLPLIAVGTGRGRTASEFAV